MYSGCNNVAINKTSHKLSIRNPRTPMLFLSTKNFQFFSGESNNREHGCAIIANGTADTGHGGHAEAVQVRLRAVCAGGQN